MNPGPYGLRRLLRPTPPTEPSQFGRRVARTRSGRPFRLLLLGGDIGALSQARSFYEAYGVPAAVVARAVTPHHTGSSMFDLRYDDGLGTAEGLVRVVNEVAALDPTTLLVSTSFDQYVVELATHRERLAGNVVVPYATAEAISAAVNKVEFSRLAQEVGMTHPRTLVLKGGSGQVPDIDSLGYPLIGKPADGDELEAAGMEGLEKVFVLRERAQVDDLLRRIEECGFTGEFLFQERVPGSDNQMRILTSYRDTAGRLRLCSYGHSVIEEHDPRLRGNPAVIRTGLEPGEVGQQVGRLLERLDWVGYANFDIKVDPRDGAGHVFELNPRLGRSNYYLNVSGTNPVELLVEDWVGEGGQHLDLRTDRRGLYLVVPVALALAYGHGVRLAMLASLLSGQVRNPLVKVWAGARRQDLARAWYMTLSTLNQYRRFHRFYPLGQARRERKEAQ